MNRDIQQLQIMEFLPDRLRTYLKIIVAGTHNIHDLQLQINSMGAVQDFKRALPDLGHPKADKADPLVMFLCGQQITSKDQDARVIRFLDYMASRWRTDRDSLLQSAFNQYWCVQSKMSRRILLRGNFQSGSERPNGLAFLLRNEYNGLCHIFNQTSPGSNTKDNLLRTDLNPVPLLGQANVILIILFLGFHAKSTLDNQNSKVELKECKTNIIEFVQHPRVRAQSPKIILVVPYQPLRRTPDYRLMVRDLGKLRDVAICELGLTTSQAIILESIRACLSRNWPDLSARELAKASDSV